MSWLSVLRAILNLLYIFSWIGMICAPFMAYISVNIIDYDQSDIGSSFVKSEPFLYFIAFLSIIGYFFYLMMIYHLKKSVFKMNHRQLLGPDLKRHLFKAGIYCISGGLVSKISQYFYKYISSPNYASEYIAYRTPIDINNGYESVFLILAFGIFLIIFSKIIERSLMLQEENALTV